MSTPQASASGRLGARSVVELLVYARDRKLTGTLVFQPEEGSRAALYFQEGQIRKSHAPGPRIGDLVVKGGVATRDAVERAAAAASREPIGKRLVSSAGVDASVLSELLNQQAIERVGNISLLPPTTVFAFYDNTDVLGQVQELPSSVDTLAFALNALTHSKGLRRVKALVDSLGNAPLKFHSGAKLSRFRPSSNQNAIVDVLRVQPQSFDQLRNTGILKEDELYCWIGILMLTRSFDIGNGKMPVGSDESSVELDAQRMIARVSRNPSPVPGNSSSSSSRSMSAPSMGAASGSSGSTRAMSMRASSSGNTPAVQQKTWVEEMLVQAEKLVSKEANLSFYEILNVPEDATSAMISSGYFEFAKKWHPDRCNSGGAALQDMASRVFAKGTEAHKCLNDSKLRAEYDSRRKAGTENTSDEELVQKALRASTAYQKAEYYLKRNDYEQAFKEAKSAAEDDPGQKEYLALAGYARFRLQGDEASRTEALNVLEAVCEEFPQHAKQQYMFAQVLKADGQSKRALKLFALVAELDPRNVDAAREVRIHKMRKGGPGDSDPPKKGIFDRMLKR